MRIKALILFFPFAVFLTETASFIPAMKEACTIVAAKKSSCSKIESLEKCNKQKEAENNDSPEKKCEDSPDCKTCPVCYTFIFQPQYEWAAGHFILMRSYNLHNTDFTSFYYPDAWKPPNVFA